MAINKKFKLRIQCQAQTQTHSFNSSTTATTIFSIFFLFAIESYGLQTPYQTTITDPIDHTILKIIDTNLFLSDDRKKIYEQVKTNYSAFSAPLHHMIFRRTIFSSVSSRVHLSDSAGHLGVFLRAKTRKCSDYCKCACLVHHL